MQLLKAVSGSLQLLILHSKMFSYKIKLEFFSNIDITFKRAAVSYKVSRNFKCLINFQNEEDITFKIILPYLVLFS